MTTPTSVTELSQSCCKVDTNHVARTVGTAGLETRRRLLTYLFGTPEIEAARSGDQCLYGKPLPAKAIREVERAGLEPATSWVRYR